MQTRFRISGTLMGRFLALAVLCVPTGALLAQPSDAALTALQTAIVRTLSGDGEIRPGVTLAARTTLEQRKEARDYLSKLLSGMGLEPLRHSYSPEGENVYAILPSGKPSAELVVIGAHYDSARGVPGANDNATGVAAIAGVAQHLTKVSPRVCDVAVVFFDEEERGLRGSRAFAQRLVDEQRAVHSVHTIDQMGWDQDGDRAIELELTYEGARELYTAAAASLKMTIELRETMEPGSDHSAFRRLGFKAVGLTEEYRGLPKDTTPFIHQPGDTADTVNFAYLASTTRLMAKAIEMLVKP